MDLLSSFTARIGQSLGTSDWRIVSQEVIDAFADATDDHQWIHVDTERAAREAPGGDTIAHGLLTLSLLPAMRAEIGVLPTEGVARAINYGYDSIRFLAPVPVGSRIRATSELLSADVRGRGLLLVRTRDTVEIEGSPKPALVAESLALLYPE